MPEDERVFTDCDVATLKAARALVESHIAEPDVLLQLTRVTGQALARIADAQVAARVGTAAEVDIGGIAELVTASEPLLTYVWRRHLVAAALRAATRR